MRFTKTRLINANQLLMRKLKIIANISTMLIVGFFVLTSCESDPDSLGNQFLEGDAAIGEENSYDLVAYNINHHDTLRSDARVLSTGILGAFNEPVYGSQKAAYVSQFRPISYNPDFGTNPKVDSVIMQIVPAYSQDRDEIIVDSIKITHDVDEDADDDEKIVDSLIIRTSYPIVKYGNKKINGKPAKLTFQIHEVLDFLNDNRTEYFSNKSVNLGPLLGSGSLDNGMITKTEIKNADNQSEIYTQSEAIRIPLDNQYFQDKIIGAQGQSALNDAASFIRYIRGLRISVVEDDGYLFYFAPENVSIKMYYSNDKTDDEGKTTRNSAVYNFSLGPDNARFEQYTFQRPGTYNSVINNINKITGDAQLYLQGTGGPGAGFKIPDATIQAIKNLYETQKIAIVSAKIRVYSDESIWDNDYTKPDIFTVLREGEKDFIPDMLKLGGSPYYQRIRKKELGEDSNSVSYDIGITQTLKDIVEKDIPNLPIEINVGDFMSAQSANGTASYVGWQYTTRVFSPSRLVLVGTDPSRPEKSAQLVIIYTKKNP